MDSHAPRSAAARRTSWPGQEGRASPGKDPRAHPAGRRPVSVPCAPWCALLWYDHNHNARAPSALPPLFCLRVYMSTCLHVYMSTCLHVYKLSSKMAYLSAKTDIQRDKQRQTRTGAIKPRPSYYQPFVSLSRSNNSFCLPASACRFMYSVNAASSSSPLPLPFAFT